MWKKTKENLPIRKDVARSTARLVCVVGKYDECYVPITKESALFILIEKEHFGYTYEMDGEVMFINRAH